ncbi:DNA topology modulation protein FlaR [Bacillus sp. P14.5]|uniref:DNA topology modulation protein FlaR n=1 Tax=Bacillus sp. P14.5 TaxID=1983400 RepID=UPI0019643234|nr:DNA topology modulation protein FlaR [Bacillus sp. P14.5]
MKINMIGSVGSGKSTLGRRISSEMGIPLYELDNVVWQRNESGDIRNSPEVRDKEFNRIIKQKDWIIEGVHHTWTTNGFREADIIIYLDTPVMVRNWRILKRFTVQKLGFEKGNYKQTWSMLRKMYQWNYQFEKVSKPEIMNILKPHGDKLKIITDNRSIKEITL